ncbi:ATP-binding cassette domain-containing protein [Pseudomaricurvus sp. HS19]|uniref:ATP-binding cassette domain-containing protein n=1 Tax=Pseudomaricurvus sp. HS19 TaxID=2692626 RepID=UPI00192645A4|nr:ATP-binding cassette domain-containing protein [Pseudomaricurvus sp. HS19]
MMNSDSNACSTSGIALRVEQVCFSYERTAALDHLSLQLAAGGFLALLGPNGAGKSTLMALLTGLLRPASGSLEIFGYDLSRQPSLAMRQLGVVFQQPTLDLDLTVEQNLRYHCALQGLSPKAARQAIGEQLQRFVLADCRQRRVRSLNGGHRRRVELARALLHSPRLLLLDEPSVGLDIQSRRELNEHVRTLCRESGVAVLWTTHLLDELLPQDQLLVLHKGCAQAQGQVAELLHQHHSDSLNGLFSKLTEAA